MPPRPGTKFHPSIDIPESAGLLITAARTPPMIGVPPNSAAALTPTKRFIPKMTALPITASICATGVPWSSGNSFSEIFKRPVINPQAMNAGINGRKICAILRNMSFMGVAFFLRIASCSAFPSPISALCIGSITVCADALALVVLSGISLEGVCCLAMMDFMEAVTLCARPGPRTICSSEPFGLMPSTPSNAFSLACMPSSSFFRCTRSLVMQFVICSMLSAGPIISNI